MDSSGGDAYETHGETSCILVCCYRTYCAMKGTKTKEKGNRRVEENEKRVLFDFGMPDATHTFSGDDSYSGGDD